jgi:hypothetical protein
LNHNGIGFSSIAKGLLVGIVVGAAAMSLYVVRSRPGFRRDILMESGRVQSRDQPLSKASVEKNVETGKPENRNIGWLVVYCFATAVEMISEWRLNKK